MALMHVQFYAQTLGLSTSMYAILPQAQQGIGQAGAQSLQPPKVLYLLHGLSDDYSIWLRRSAIERYAAQYNLAVIMPEVGRSFYSNEVHGNRYWDFISQELPETVAHFFKVSPKREDTFVAGLSMGGYGALKLGLSFPERFAAAACFSGALDVVDMFKNKAADDSFFDRIYGTIEQLEGSDNDLYALAKKTAVATKKPNLMLACGTSDFLYGQFKAMVPYLESLGYNVTSTEQEGTGHEWRYWDEMIEKALPWMLG